MSEPIRVLIHGASGRMGRALLRLCAQAPVLAVAGAVSRKPAQRVIDGVPQFAASELSGVPAFDVAIDFSRPEAFDRVLALCVERGVALVSGTTGLGEDQRDALQAAGARIPVLWAANFSLGVAVLAELVERAAHALQGWDCDIVEAHHAGKQDAPSGTALALGAAAGRGGAQPRYASLRAGDIVGEHTVQFATVGERIELVHRASSRDIFARGALHAATRLAARAPGLYRLADLVA
ncbi:4-hydroxy-tetrahydrodipicolinate reductase [Cognatiluteimonas weifangensis]|uniref:4-hydroxy-tetrahydrodipicolinate reductase n=1 Tax=Cognatiluteimonas weifangensis TaxID=2303539 RepID=A0A372DNS1_9GAMM|nr:4-hydroxy-tetrahydrodipicolinate reductase [Luteimonas weifangensis]RFP61240.1 4-hydroxy-tetrahydrodipicolinate reductase [Luteimonas weifangensis]